MTPRRREPALPRMPDDPYHDGWWYLSLRHPPTAVDDEEISATVARRLASDPWTGTEPIEVDVRERMVILTGKVRSPSARDAAIAIAQATSGVVGVDARLSVSEV